MMDHTSEEEMMKQRMQKWLDAYVESWQQDSDVLGCGRNLLLWRASEKPDNRWRQLVQCETLDMLKTPDARENKRTKATANVATWKARAEERAAAKARPPEGQVRVLVLEGDWGEVAGKLTKEYGLPWVVLNMANADIPGGGGGYVNGTPAQEENMFRRTDCHFSLVRDGSSAELPMERVKKYDEHWKVHKGDYRYTREATELINGRSGVVYLGKMLRICFRGKELDATGRQGYEDLPDEDIFPFYEMRAAAVDRRRDGLAGTVINDFDENECRLRIEAQLETLRRKGLRHAVLSAFGCGAFRNPPTEVARIYAESVSKFADHLDVVAFAIYYPGYGPKENFEAFQAAFKELSADPIANVMYTPADITATSLPTRSEKDSEPENPKKTEVTVSIPKKRLKCIRWKFDNDGAFVWRVIDEGPMCDLSFNDRLTFINKYPVDGMTENDKRHVGEGAT